jgi:hypothetical protein
MKIELSVVRLRADVVLEKPYGLNLDRADVPSGDAVVSGDQAMPPRISSNGSDLLGVERGAQAALGHAIPFVVQAGACEQVARTAACRVVAPVTGQEARRRILGQDAGCDRHEAMCSPGPATVSDQSVAISVRAQCPGPTAAARHVTALADTLYQRFLLVVGHASASELGVGLTVEVAGEGTPPVRKAGEVLEDEPTALDPAAIVRRSTCTLSTIGHGSGILRPASDTAKN